MLIFHSFFSLLSACVHIHHTWYAVVREREKRRCKNVPAGPRHVYGGGAPTIAQSVPGRNYAQRRKRGRQKTVNKTKSRERPRRNQLPVIFGAER